MPIDSPDSGIVEGYWPRLPTWFERAKKIWPHVVDFEIKNENTTFEAYAWCRDRLGPPTIASELMEREAEVFEPNGHWMPYGFSSKIPQIWFRTEENACLFKVFFG